MSPLQAEGGPGLSAGTTVFRVITDFGACGAVTVNQGVITSEWTAPIYSKFIGQPLANLRRWRRVTSVEELMFHKAHRKELQ